ncbi:FecR family protein [Pedobacter faecalis]|uniref:FecR family protein n=1 Tax=Pedobacter faecalis TaxID=3041495 RepID=UPI00254FE844|nr:FecR family protein [Pedobacter sp. ELA7]
MTEHHERLTTLFSKYLSKELNEEERLEFLSYVQNPAYTQQIDHLISHSYEHPETLHSLDRTAGDRIFGSVVADRPQKSSRLIGLWPRLSAAVAVGILLVGVVLWNNNSSEQTQRDAYQNDITSGVTGATLTLANGKKVRLGDVKTGEVAKEAGVIIKKSESGDVVYEIVGNTGESEGTNTLSTTNGETYKLRLPDGSYVWLNSASSLTYSSRLIKGGKRRVSLTGEGYFEIARDAAHPFVVTTSKQEVEVLGTHFNLNSYGNEALVTTTLIEGSVLVRSGRSTQILKPGEQALNDGKALRVSEVNIDNVVDWKNGDFNLDELDFRLAMRKIARWYNVDVVYEASVPSNIRSGGWISRSKNLSEILKHIESSGQVSFKIEGRKVYVAKGK